MSANFSDNRTLHETEHESFDPRVERRRSMGRVWAIVLQISLIIGIVALTALLYNIINQAFGLTAVRNTINPSTVVRNAEEMRIMAMDNVVSSEDDNELASAIADNPNAIGFFGYAYYLERSETLRPLAVDGVAPSAESVDAGEYPMARPLFLYTAEQILAQNPSVGDFLAFYLENVDAAMETVGYFAADDSVIEQAQSAVSALRQDETDEAKNITIAGSSTVFPVTQYLANQYKEETNYAGTISVESIGTNAGLSALCDGRTIDIANASRAYTRPELNACDDNLRTPVELRIGTDALAVVTSSQNTFLQDVTTDQLAQIFTEAEFWSDVNSEWPSEPILRYVPSLESGTLDFFAEFVFDETTVQDLPPNLLAATIRNNVREGVVRRFEAEADMPLEEMSQQALYDIVQERVVAPEIEGSWNLFESILNREEIEATVATRYPEAELQWRTWVNSNFITSPQSDDPAQAGIRVAILGSLWVIAVTLAFAMPVGVGAAIYLEEYAADNLFNRIIKTNIDNLAGVPSIIYGMLGLAVFVRGTMIPGWGGMGRTVLAGGITLGLLVLPLIIINAQEAIRAVPNSLRQAGYGLGATKWQVIWNHVLPSALPGILTGNILSLSRAIGETAPLVVVGASTFIVSNPEGFGSSFTVLPVQIYQWTARPQAEFRHIAAAAIVVLLVLLLSLNASAIYLRNRFSARA